MDEAARLCAYAGMKPDRAPDYTNVYNADYGCASGGIEWGPYVPESL